MARTSLTLAAAVAAALSAAPASAQTAPEAAPTAAPTARPAPPRPAPPKVRRPHQPTAEAAPTAPATASTALQPAQAARPGLPAGARALADALVPDLRSSVGIPKTIFVQRFVAESLYRFDRENQRTITLDQLRQNISHMEKSVREGADRWWNEANRTKSGKVGRDDAQAAAVDQFRKLTGLSPEQTETKQQSGIRESFERGSAQQFSRFDVNGDGYVVRAEVDHRIAEDIERIERSARITRALVEDGTRGRKGFLDLDKATLALGGAFDALDANRDGILGTEELPASTRRPEVRSAAALKAPPAPAATATPTTAARPAAKPPIAAIRSTVPGQTTEARALPPAPKKLMAPTAPTATRADAAAPPADAPAQQAARPAVKPRPQPVAKPAAAAAPRPAVDPALFAQPLPTVRGYGAASRTAQPAEAR